MFRTHARENIERRAALEVLRGDPRRDADVTRGAVVAVCTVVTVVVVTVVVWARDGDGGEVARARAEVARERVGALALERAEEHHVVRAHGGDEPHAVEAVIDVLARPVVCDARRGEGGEEGEGEETVRDGAAGRGGAMDPLVVVGARREGVDASLGDAHAGGWRDVEGGVRWVAREPGREGGHAPRAALGVTIVRIVRIVVVVVITIRSGRRRRRRQRRRRRRSRRRGVDVTGDARHATSRGVGVHRARDAPRRGEARRGAQ